MTTTMTPVKSADRAGEVRTLLEQVTDPEIPVLTIADLGVLRDVQVQDGRVEVVITPTYSGCPAMKTIEDDIEAVLREAGYTDIDLRTRLSPAWTTEWMSEAGRRKLEEYGIAPPACRSEAAGEAVLEPQVACPRCRSLDTEVVSEFGSTACKALYRCRDCLEPFDYFKRF